MERNTGVSADPWRSAVRSSDHVFSCRTYGEDGISTERFPQMSWKDRDSHQGVSCSLLLPLVAARK
jgi:hypothetical protein